MTTTDLEIRRHLRERLEAEHVGEPGTLILDELGVLQGAARADLAVVNGSLAAWEIKSERDTLRRLAGQVDAYSRVFDQVTLVVAPDHLARGRAAVPRWWGLSTARAGADGRVVITHRRKPRINPGTDPAAVAELLWRDEALAILQRHGLIHGLRSKPRRALWTRLAAALPREVLAEEVREALKARRDWRADPPPH